MKQLKWSALALVVLVASIVPALTHAEVLTDRCSGKVRIDTASGPVVLSRGSNGKTGWTGELTVTVNKSDCCSGNVFANDCGKFQWQCQPPGEKHWYDEKSRCKGKDKRIRAKLGPDRLVNFECLGGGFDPDCKNKNGGNGPAAGAAGGPCQSHDICQRGAACDLSTNKCEKITISGCGDLGEPCCAPSSADPIGCGGSRQCSGGTCQHCGSEDQLCCGGAVVAGGGCAAGLTCNGTHCSSTGTSKEALSVFNDEPEAALSVTARAVLSVVERDGNRFTRIFSSNGVQWYFDASVTSQNLLAAENQIGQGTFTSGPAAAVSSSGKLLHVFGRGSDNRMWRAYSSSGGKDWSLAWAPIGQGVFTSGPAAALGDDGQSLHVFGRGTDNKIWRAYSPDGGKSWAVAWAPVGEGVFTSAPAAAISADGKQLHLFGRGKDNKIWRAYSPDGGATWPVAWAPIGDAAFTSAPAAAISGDGRSVHVVGRGTANKIIRAASSDGGKTWSTATSPIGDLKVGSAPGLSISADGKTLHLLARAPATQGGGFQAPPGIWHTSSTNGGSTWSAWSAVSAKGKAQ